MRVLRLHTRYAVMGGEDHSYNAEVKLLIDNGFEVKQFLASNADVIKRGKLATVGSLFRSPFDRKLYKEIRAVCREFQPHVAHADNLWFALSPSALAACHDEGVATVQSLRNYRLMCLNGYLQRDGHPCEDCIGRAPWPGVRHRCYRKSTLASVAVARWIRVNRKRSTWDKAVDVFLTPSKFARQKFVVGGLADERVIVKPNFMADPGPVLPPGIGGVYVGRLSQEKGVHTLLRAWSTVRDAPLTIVGDGPARLSLQKMAVTLGLRRVNFMGHLDQNKCLDAIRHAAFLVFPSEWYETFGRTIMESFAVGRPVIASRLGAAAELVDEGETGLLFAPGDAGDLSQKIGVLLGSSTIVRSMSKLARDCYEKRFTPETNLLMLREVYDIAVRRSKRSGRDAE